MTEPLVVPWLLCVQDTVKRISWRCVVAMGRVRQRVLMEWCKAFIGVVVPHHLEQRRARLSLLLVSHRPEKIMKAIHCHVRLATKKALLLSDHDVWQQTGFCAPTSGNCVVLHFPLVRFNEQA